MSGVIFIGTSHHGAPPAGLLVAVLTAVFKKMVIVKEFQPCCHEDEDILGH